MDHGALTALVAAVVDVEGEVIPGDCAAAGGDAGQHEGASFVGFDFAGGVIEAGDGGVALNAEIERAGCRCRGGQLQAGGRIDWSGRIGGDVRFAGYAVLLVPFPMPQAVTGVFFGSGCKLL